eukprot:CAMPEP_0114541890 /NCGR_PEP_ID=MMETSP0114-20121206/1546_1 /TAXON_ID=31324 /ORGANISM="Goniomonas sp, Strain m" /LENGTH=218 /DNA_ID=CAMNT_0001726157 /DNA_START=125 /DNA_END=781 /DNA_ORIENTATION=-
MGSKKQDDTVDDTGIPLNSTYDKLPPIPILYPTFASVFTVIGLVAAWFIAERSPKSEAKIALLAAHGLGWIYASLLPLKVTGLVHGIILGMARKASKVNLPNQHVYSVYTKPGAARLGYVLMEEEGALGRFNRAQRAFVNFSDTLSGFLLIFLLAGFVFPFPTFCLACAFFAFRCIGAAGYTANTDSRMSGNLPASLVLAVMEGLVLLTAYKAIVAEA